MPKRWIERWKARGVWRPADEVAIERGYWFDERFAEHFRGFGRKYLRLWEGAQWAGKPFELLEWQWLDVFAPLFGWFRFDDELGRPVRRYTRAFIFVPKKNGKSPMAAYVGAYGLIADGEPGGKTFSAATTKEQAAIVHGHAVEMIKSSSEELYPERIKIHGSTKCITYLPLNATYRAISSGPRAQEGLNGCAICDEIHVWQGRRLWDALKYCTASRTEPMTFMITTAGEDVSVEESVCREQYEYAQSVLNGSVEDLGFFSYLREASPDDDPGDPAVWAKANPSLGTILRQTEMAEAYKEAQKSGAAMASFCRYRLNIWSATSHPWLDGEAWKACQHTFTADDLEGEPCYAGLDLSQSDDTSALVLVFPRDDGTYRQLAWFWLPEDTIQKYRDRIDYAAWVKQGFLETTPYDWVDEGAIETRLVEIVGRFDLRMLLYDPYRAETLTQRIENDHGIPRLKFDQTIKNFAEPTSAYESLVKKGLLHHNGNPVLSWQAKNVRVITDSNANCRPVKPKREDLRKIDGIVAGIMALSEAIGHATAGGVYDDPDKDLVMI